MIERTAETGGSCGAMAKRELPQRLGLSEPAQDRNPAGELLTDLGEGPGGTAELFPLDDGFVHRRLVTIPSKEKTHLGPDLGVARLVWPRHKYPPSAGVVDGAFPKIVSGPKSPADTSLAKSRYRWPQAMYICRCFVPRINIRRLVYQQLD